MINLEKQYVRLGAVYYCILGVLAILFYQERTCYTDIAYHTFCITKDSTFAIQNYRFGAMFTQAFPLLAVKLHLSLFWVSIFYSIGFMVWYGGLYWVCVKVFKQVQYGIILMLLSALAMGHTFYWIQSEFPQGLALFVAFFAMLANHKDFTTFGMKEQVFYSVSLLFLAFFHPMMLFAFMFMIGWLFLQQPEKKKLWIASALIFLVIYFIKAKFFKTIYDSGKTTEGIKNLSKLFPHYFTPANKTFLKELLPYYYGWVVGFIVLAIHWIKLKKYLPLVYVGGFFIGYVFFVNVTLPEGGEHAYMENLYLPLSLMIAVPLTTHILWEKKNKLVFWVFVTFVGLRCIHIVACSDKFSQRIRWEKRVIEHVKPEQKWIISSKDMPDNVEMNMAWGTPYEFWLLSTLHKQESYSIIIHTNPSEIAWGTSLNHAFLSTWGAFEYENLPKKYFKFKHTTETYQNHSLNP